MSTTGGTGDDEHGVGETPSTAAHTQLLLQGATALLSDWDDDQLTQRSMKQRDFEATEDTDAADDGVVTAYAPFVFAKVRTLLGWSTDAYLECLDEKQKVNDMGSPGKSGSMLCASANGRLVFKTLPMHEAKAMLQLLPAYTRHLRSNPTTMLCRFLALYKLEHTASGVKQHVLVMDSVFDPVHTDLAHLHMDLLFDLKGSTAGRTSGDADSLKPTSVRKDLDVGNLRIAFPSQDMCDAWVEQLRSDVALLQMCAIMDYSLLLAVYHVDDEDLHLLDDSQWTPSTRAWRVGSTVYVCGIIDILQVYNGKKKLAKLFKSIKSETDTLSTVPPPRYAMRFVRFLQDLTSVLDTIE